MDIRRYTLAALCAAAVILCLNSCSTGPSAPQPGSPAFYWGAAGETWRAGDYLRTLDNLAHLTAGPSDFATKARPWEIVTASGIARGYGDLADSAEAAMHKSPARANELRRQMTAWRGTANSTVLELADTFQKFAAENTGTSVPLAFAWPPAGNTAQPAKLDQFASGAPLPAADLEGLETMMIQRGVMLSAAKVTGSGDDAARAQDLFKQPSPSVTTQTFMVNMAQVLYDLSAIYGPKKLDTPRRGEMLITLATAALKPWPEDKSGMALLQKIQKETKVKK